MNKSFCYLFFLVLAFSCSTPPQGELQLKPEMERDLSSVSSKSNNLSLLEGRPQMIQARLYPQIYKGNIIGGTWVLIQVEREKINLKSYIEKLEE